MPLGPCVIPVISYQELLGSYNTQLQHQMLRLVISYQELLGSYNSRHGA